MSKTLKELREENSCGKSCKGCDFLSFCGDCEENLCSAYDKDYKNIDETGGTLCGICNAVRKRSSSIPPSSKDEGILEVTL